MEHAGEAPAPFAIDWEAAAPLPLLEGITGGTTGLRRRIR